MKSVMLAPSMNETTCTSQRSCCGRALRGGDAARGRGRIGSINIANASIVGWPLFRCGSSTFQKLGLLPKTTVFFILLLLSAVSHMVAQTTLPSDAYGAFSVDRLRTHVQELDSDKMRVRDTPSPELERAADYIAQEFKKFGLQPLGSSYKLPYQIVVPDLDPDPARTNLIITVNGVERAFRLGVDFIPFEFGGTSKVTSAAVSYVGFGITAPEYEFDDYKDLDVRGRVVIAMRGEPEGSDASKFRGTATTRHFSTSEKVRNAFKHGAAGILLVDALRTPRKPVVSGYTWPSLFPAVARKDRGLQLVDARSSIPAIHIGEEVVNMLLGSVDSLRSWVKVIDREYVATGRHLDGVTVSTSVKLKVDPVTVHNVAGILQGSEKNNEYVVFGSRYDNAGARQPNASGDSMNNALNDDASGTASLLMVAEALASSATRPDRSVVFVCFFGKEKGLLGSKAYVASSPLPMERCVAMFNSDMIGRCEDGKLSICGKERCPELISLNEQENSKLERPYQLVYNIEHQFFRHDQAAFAVRRIPVIFYHIPEQESDRQKSNKGDSTNFSDLLSISRLSASVLWRATQLPRTAFASEGKED